MPNGFGVYINPAESTHISYDQNPSQPTQSSTAMPQSPAQNTRTKKRATEAAEPKKTLGVRRRLVKK